ncbi:MAG: hypothetical protein R3C15_16840 [Thermoleophilia bacterium]
MGRRLAREEGERLVEPGRVGRELGQRVREPQPSRRVPDDVELDHVDTVRERRGEQASVFSGASAAAPLWPTRTMRDPLRSGDVMSSASTSSARRRPLRLARSDPSGNNAARWRHRPRSGAPTHRPGSTRLRSPGRSPRTGRGATREDHEVETKRARIRFWGLILGLPFLGAILTITIWDLVQSLFGIGP